MTAALARCGDPEGVAILESYLVDSRRMLVRYAQRELATIKGLTDGPGGVTAG